MGPQHLKAWLLKSANTVGAGKWFNFPERHNFVVKTNISGDGTCTVNIETRDELGNIFLIDQMAYGNPTKDIQEFRGSFLELRANVIANPFGSVVSIEAEGS